MKNSKIIALLLTLTAIFGCSSNKPERQIEATGQYEVKVFRDGKEVKNFGKSLIHRVELSPKDIGRFVAANGEMRELPFATQIERDGQGKLRGLRVNDTRRAGGTAVLGLADKDVVTAVGRKPIKSKADFSELFVELKQTQSSSLTLERNSEPHKILYYLADPANKAAPVVQ